MAPRREIRRKAIQITGQMAVIILTCSLLLIIGVLEFMSDPPDFWFDAIWVSNHRGSVAVGLLALATAVLVSLPGLRVRRTRWLVVAIWALAVAVVCTVFGERLGTIARVLCDRYVW